MPVGVQLVGARGLDNGNVVAGASHKLQAYGEILFGKAAGNGKRGQPAQISDAAQRIGVRKSGLEI
jgi:glutamate synthase domain-containing protein 3